MIFSIHRKNEVEGLRVHHFSIQNSFFFTYHSLYEGFSFPHYRKSYDHQSSLIYLYLFQSAIDESTEETFKNIFCEYGEILYVDIPQCDPMRKHMEPEISGIQLSSWLLGQVCEKNKLFFLLHLIFWGPIFRSLYPIPRILRFC